MVPPNDAYKISINQWSNGGANRFIRCRTPQINLSSCETHTSRGTLVEAAPGCSYVHFCFSANKESGVAGSCEKGTSNGKIASTRYAILTQEPISSVEQWLIDRRWESWAGNRTAAGSCFPANDEINPRLSGVGHAGLR
jgi:hypothetical protein